MTPRKLRALRRRLGLTQQELAGKIGVPSNTLARWERGEMDMHPSMEKLVDLTTRALRPDPRRPRFRASRGGHAPNHLRDWFCEWVETGDRPDEMVERGRSLDWLLGQLWNCTDTLPGWVVTELDINGEARSYGAAARLIRRDPARFSPDEGTST